MGTTPISLANAKSPTTITLGSQHVGNFIKQHVGAKSKHTVVVKKTSHHTYSSGKKTDHHIGLEVMSMKPIDEESALGEKNEPAGVEKQESNKQEGKKK